MNRTVLLIAIMSLVVLVALGIVSVGAHTRDETTSEHNCWNWDEQDMKSHHGWMHGDDFDEHHSKMLGTTWEENSEHCHRQGKIRDG